MTTDPKLVEALADWICERGGYGEALEQSIQTFFEMHRLVQLPEEPWGWEWEASDGIGATWGRVPTQRAAVVQARNAGCGTGRIRPLYIIPGDPQEVDDG